MAPHSSTLAWKIPWMEESGELQSMGSLRVGHDWVTSLSLFHFHALEKEMATHSSFLAWRIPGAGEPGGLTSTGSGRVGHDWSDLAAMVYKDQTFKEMFVLTQNFYFNGIKKNSRREVRNTINIRAHSFSKNFVTEWKTSPPGEVCWVVSERRQNYEVIQSCMLKGDLWKEEGFELVLREEA